MQKKTESAVTFELNFIETKLNLIQTKGKTTAMYLHFQQNNSTSDKLARAHS